MATLEKRIEALEQASYTNTEVVIFIHLVGMGATDKEIERITKGGQEWQRQPNESEQDLKDRATREASPPAPKCRAMFFCY